MKQFETSFTTQRKETISTSTRRYLALAGLIIYWSLLFSSTHIPRVPHVVSFYLGFDKVCHFVGYTGLAYLVSLAWTVHRPMTRPLGISNFLVVVGVLSFYGVLDEVTQPLIGRSCELADWIADVAGAAVGVSFFAAVTALARRIGLTALRSDAV